MYRKQKFAYFFSGLLCAALVASMVSPTFAALAQKTIKVFTGVNIYIDDQKLDPRDANGNPVEVFVYNGTTYLPVRAVGEAVGKTVQWDGKTNSVYLGKHSSNKPSVWMKDMDYFTSEYDFRMEIFEQVKDNLNQTHTNAMAGHDKASRTYKLNGQYSAISGVLFQIYENRSWDNNGQRSYFKIYGDGQLLYSAEMAAGIEPIDFYVDLTGVLELKVVLDFDRANGDLCAAVGEFGLWT